MLVDAECTHDGSIKHLAKFAQWGWDTFERRVMQPDRLATLRALQDALLRNGFARLRPGGTLVYATCSFARAQNEEVVEELLRAEPSAALLPIRTLDDAPCRRGAFLPHTLRFEPRVLAHVGSVCREDRQAAAPRGGVVTIRYNFAHTALQVMPRHNTAHARSVQAHASLQAGTNGAADGLHANPQAKAAEDAAPQGLRELRVAARERLEVLHTRHAGHRVLNVARLGLAPRVDERRVERALQVVGERLRGSGSAESDAAASGLGVGERGPLADIRVRRRLVRRGGGGRTDRRAVAGEDAANGTRTTTSFG